MLMPDSNEELPASSISTGCDCVSGVKMIPPGWERSQTGFSLVELLVVTIIMLFVSTAIFGMLISNSGVQRKLENKVDAIDSIRLVADRIGKDVRMGRSFGDIYGVAQNGVNNNMILGAAGDNLFPATNDPLWSGAGAPAGWPAGMPWPATLSTQTIIVQIPLFDANGFALGLHAGQGSPPVLAAMDPQDDMETHIYQVVPDQARVGEYILQLWIFPGVAAGAPVTNPPGPVLGPYILAKGIVGPTSGNGTPEIFQLVDKLNANGGPVDPATVAPADQVRYSGLVVNMEVRKYNSSATSAIGNEVVPIKFETYLRNNRMTLAAPP